MAYTLIHPLLLVVPINAKDFGTVGETFPVQEMNILEYLRECAQSTNPQISNRLIELAKEPKAVSLSNANQYRCSFYNPTITAREEIKDDKGNVIVKKGTSYNPLSDYSLARNLLFFNATEDNQLNWAKSEDGIWILTEGKPLKLEVEENRPVYFDQYGYLTSQLRIKALPAKVSQEGKLLKIEEFSLK